MRPLLPLLVLLLLAGAPPARAESPHELRVTGHLKSLNIAYQKSPAAPQAGGLLSASSLRLALQDRLNEAVEFEFALDNRLLMRDPAQQSAAAETPNRRLDLQQDWNRGRRWSGSSAVDRLALKGSRGSFAWQLGRQAVGFGRIALFSPLDVVAPFAPAALDTDIRPGVDALHGVRYFGLGGQLGATVVFGEESEENSYLLTFTDNRSGIDLLGIGGVLRERELLGIGLAGSLGPLGVKGEVSHYRGKDHPAPGGDLHDRFAIAALELWYRFDNGLVLLTEYLYNGAGGAEPDDYAAAAAAASYREGLSFLLGRQYLLLAPSWELHPLATLSGFLIRNLADDSTLLRPQLLFSLGDNLSLDLFYSLNFGRKPAALSAPLSSAQSEFGARGDSGGLLLRWYF